MPENQAGIVEEQASDDEQTEIDTRSPDEEDETSAHDVEASMNEDPEARRRSAMEQEPELRDTMPTFEFYGSLRLHAIRHFESADSDAELSFGDGASRIGIRSEWEFTDDWWLFGRLEAGFDILDSFTAKGTFEDGDNGLESRLIYGGIDSEYLHAIWGKNWSSYYKIAGMADRFSIFGGEASGVYNAGTDGGDTGTGRANDVLQVKYYTSSLGKFNIKPFNLNLQFQQGQSIPRVKNRRYGQAWGASAWLETDTDYGIGIAYHRAEINNLDDPVIVDAGITGDAEALATSFRFYGERWYGALVLSRLENIQTTDTFKYINGKGAELYTQWEFKDSWWLVAGGNMFDPDDKDPEAGEFETRYGVLGIRKTFDSFKRMIYAEYRIDQGDYVNGDDKANEITFGIRWDFGY